MCLAGVIESAKNPPISAMARLCPRIGKLLSNPNFLARPAILGVIGSLSQVIVDCQSSVINCQSSSILNLCILNSQWSMANHYGERERRYVQPHIGDSYCMQEIQWHG